MWKIRYSQQLITTIASSFILKSRGFIPKFRGFIVKSRGFIVKSRSFVLKSRSFYVSYLRIRSDNPLDERS